MMIHIIMNVCVLEKHRAKCETREQSLFSKSLSRQRGKKLPARQGATKPNFCGQSNGIERERVFHRFLLHFAPGLTKSLPPLIIVCCGRFWCRLTSLSPQQESLRISINNIFFLSFRLSKTFPRIQDKHDLIIVKRGIL